MQKHFVTFISPGTFVAEQSTKEIPAWDVDTALEMAAQVYRPYAFHFTTRSRGPEDLDSKVTETSPTYFFGCDVYDLEQVKAKFPSETILISNMENNADFFDRVAVPRTGWKAFYAVDIGDVVLP